MSSLLLLRSGALARHLRHLAAGAVAGLLAACGDAPAPPKAPAAEAAVAAAPGARPTGAAQPAAARPEDTLPPPRCPPPAPSGAQTRGPDIVGLRLGMPLDEALHRARCSVPDGVLAFQPRWFQQLRPGQVRLPQQGFSIQRGDTSECVFKSLGDAARCGVGRRVWNHIDELITVATPGMEGAQTVAAIWRQQHWKAGQMPTRDAVLQALRDKYGREGELRPDPHGTVSWRYSPDGQPLSASDPAYGLCGGIRARPGNQTWREGCGLSISADLVPAADNPQLVQSLFVGMAHQEALLQQGDQMQAEIDRREADRQASETRQSAGTRPAL